MREQLLLGKVAPFLLRLMPVPQNVHEDNIAATMKFMNLSWPL